MSLSDPLQRLGDDVFVDVLMCLNTRDLVSVEQVCRSWKDCLDTYAMAIWRCEALSCGVEKADIDACDQLAATGEHPYDGWDRRLIANNLDRLMNVSDPGHFFARVGTQTPDGTASSARASPGPKEARERNPVSWRYVVESHARLQRAWRKARCRLSWITPFSNTVWRIKSDAEQDVLVCTSRMSGPITPGLMAMGIMTVDRETSEPLFSIADVGGYAHLEAGRGFIVFNRPGRVSPIAGIHHDDDDMNPAHEVWWNGKARARSTLRQTGESLFADSAMSHLDDPQYNPMDPNTPLPRGHYQHFRTLKSPTISRASRLHVDRADTDDEAAVFCCCAKEAVYIWHLEEDKPMDSIERVDDREPPKYIELDDEHVFICLDRQVLVYSRITHKLVVSFPPIYAAPNTIANLAFSLSLTDDFKAVPDEERLSHQPRETRDGQAALIGRAVTMGTVPGEPEFIAVVDRAIAMHPTRVISTVEEDIMYEFTAVHFTTRDLVITAQSGGVLVVRDYVRVFAECAAMEEDERAAHVARNAILLGLGTTVRQLATYHDHIVLCTSFNVLVLEGSDFPPVPELGTMFIDDSERPVLRAHQLLGNHPQAMKMSSCLQADARSVYLTYWATGEGDALGTHSSTNEGFPPPRAMSGLGMCVKVWTFTEDDEYLSESEDDMDVEPISA